MAARNLVNLETVSKAYGTRTLLDGVSLGVAEGDRIGVVGRNGDGKTTLLRMLARREAPDTGRVTHAGGLRLGVRGAARRPATRRRPSATPSSATGPAHEWARDARVRDVLAGLFGDRTRSDAVLDRAGRAAVRRRAAAGRAGPAAGRRARPARARRADEPPRRRGHRLAGRATWPPGARRSSSSRTTGGSSTRSAPRPGRCRAATVHAYDGGYSAYVLARAERERMRRRPRRAARNLVRKELAWLRRGPPARTSKPRFRIEAANALIADEPPPRDGVELMRFAGARLGKTVYDVARRDARRSATGRCSTA